MGKNSFTLLETLISITFLSIVISGFIYSSYSNDKNNENFVLLNQLENSFNTNDFTNFTRNSQSIKIIKNQTEIEFINISKYQFSNENLKIFKYEK